jgi:MYXO-CTERM domain-containing protein
MRIQLALLSSLAVVAFAPAAQASPAFPGAIQSKLSMTSAPSCALCHEGGKVGLGTVTTGFGRAMMTRGLKAGDVAALNAALDRMVADKVDSDGDGTLDVDELEAGKDPNGTTLAAANAPPVEYGCGGATVARTQGPTVAPWALLALGGVLLARRRRHGWLPLLVVGAATLAACQPYEVAYVTADVCASGALWAGGDEGSELMNPGKACIRCHAEKGEGPKFTVAGTLFAASDEKDLCGGTNANGAAVYVQDSAGKTLKLVPNEMGNFYSKLALTPPYSAWVETSDGKKRAMGAKQTLTDCNACHTQTGSGGAPGRIVLP